MKTELKNIGGLLLIFIIIFILAMMAIGFIVLLWVKVIEPYLEWLHKILS